MLNKPMLKIENIQKSFGDKEVLKGVSLEVRKGDVIVLLGPSGSGKTTLLRCINFLEKPDSGKLEFDGYSYDLRSIHKKEIHQIRLKTGFVFQNYNLFRNMTAIENVMEGLVTARKINKTEARQTCKKHAGRSGRDDPRCRGNSSRGTSDRPRYGKTASGRQGNAGA